jgi:DNA-binding MarR family transcriptional regulator
MAELIAAAEKGPVSDEGLGSRFASADDSPGLALWHVTNRWQAVMRSALAPHELTHVQYVLPATLVWHRSHEPDAQLSHADLAGLAATDVMMTSQVLRALEAKGLVGRMPHPRDGRARVLRPTPAASPRRSGRRGTWNAPMRSTSPPCRIRQSSARN